MKNNKISAKGKGAGYKVVSKSKGKVTIKSKVTGKTYKGKSVKGLMASRKKAVMAAHANGWKK